MAERGERRRARHHADHAQVPRSRALWDETRKPGAPLTSLAKAMLYELQPVRFAQVDYVGTLRRWRARAVAMQKTCLSLALALFQWLKSLRLRGWLVLGGVVCYLYLVKYLHQMLDAGPMILIVSALVAIFTVGLGEGDSEMSAYSVFNQGFQRIMGSVNVEALVAQHVGGGLGMAMQAGRDDNQEVQDHPPPPPRARGVAAAAAPNHPPPARKSGKKARRRNLELRREMQRQRQAAAAMGLQPGAEEDFGLADEWAIAQALHQMENDEPAAEAAPPHGNDRGEAR